MKLPVQTPQDSTSNAPEEAPVPSAHPAVFALYLLIAVPFLLYLSHWFRTDDFYWMKIYGAIPAHRLDLIFTLENAIFFWRPLQGWMFSVAWPLFGMNPVPFNVALATGWLLCVAQLEGVARAYTRDRLVGLLTVVAAAFMGSLTFMTGYWISLIGAVWGNVLMLAGLRLYLWMIRQGEAAPWWAAGVIALLGTLAILMKESLGSMVGVFALLLLLERGWHGWRNPKLVVPVAVMVAVTLFTYWMGLSVLKAAEDIDLPYTRDPLWKAPWNAHRMVNILLWPLAASGGKEDATLLDAVSNFFAHKAMVAPLFLLAACVYMRNRAMALGLAWAYGTCFPAAFLHAHLTNRYLHLPAEGLAIALAVAIVTLCRHLRNARRLFSTFVYTVVGAYTLLAMIEWVDVAGRETQRLEISRALHQAILRHRVPDGTSAIYIAYGFDEQRHNLGFGFREMAQLTYGRDNVQLEVSHWYKQRGFREFYEREFDCRYFLKLEGAEFMLERTECRENKSGGAP